MRRVLCTVGIALLLIALASAQEEGGDAPAPAEEKKSEGDAEQPAENPAAPQEDIPTPAPTSASKRKPRSIVQACRKELPVLCKDRKDLMRCLTTKTAEVKDPVCNEWLGARATCNKFLLDNKKCTSKESARACLRNIPVDVLPKDCSETEYYKSVKLFGAFRRRSTKAPK